MESFDNLSGEDRLKAENDFLKMKMMLEHGAKFSGNENDQLPAGLENELLNHVMAFEKHFEENKTIRVFDKIGKPAHFKPVKTIPDDQIDKAWNDLRRYLNEYSIDLDVCSPNVTSRELYRFTTEELFEYETDYMDTPGWTTNFIYDEFYPDPVYDNSRLVQQDLLQNIFRKEALFYDINYLKEGFMFNNRRYDLFKTYKERINRFKSFFDEIKLLESSVNYCQVRETLCEVKGNYKAIARTGKEEMIYEGDFRVDLVLGELGYWDMITIEIGGFDPA